MVKLIPSHLYTHHSDGKSRNILREVPWLMNATDGVLFYFMGMSHGQAVCGTSPLCGGITPPVTWVVPLVIVVVGGGHPVGTRTRTVVKVGAGPWNV